jgi:hypothetical protein
MNYRAITFWVVIGVYVLTALVALGGLIGVFAITEKSQDRLTIAILIESAVCVFALFKAAKFFEPVDSVKSLRYESERLLATLWHHEQGAKGFCVSISPAATNFRTFLRAVAQLHTLELVSVLPTAHWSVSLTPEGKHFCRENDSKLKKITDHYFTEASPMPMQQ